MLPKGTPPSRSLLIALTITSLSIGTAAGLGVFTFVYAQGYVELDHARNAAMHQAR